MSPSLTPNSLYRQTTDYTEGGGLTREHCNSYAKMTGNVLYSLQIFVNVDKLLNSHL
jgi:hypothetical protein